MKKPIVKRITNLRIAGFLLVIFSSSKGCIACDCTGGMSNTGAGCSTVFRDTVGLMFMPMLANDGTENGIDVTGGSVLNKAYFDALTNQADPSKRLYPVATDGGLKDVDQMRGQIVTRTFTDGDDEFIRQGTKPFKGWITGRYATPQYAAKLESVRCDRMGVYKPDRGGNLVGSLSADRSTLLPIEISSGSFYATFVDATPDKNNAYIEIGFNFAQSEVDKTLQMVACSEFTDYRISSIRGLVDVCAEFSEITNAGVTVKLTTDQGTPLNPILAKGITTQTDWVFDDTTANRTLNIASITETAVKGIYKVLWAATTPDDGDEITLTISHTGYDFTCVASTPIVIPMS